MDIYNGAFCSGKNEEDEVSVYFKFRSQSAVFR